MDPYTKVALWDNDHEIRHAIRIGSVATVQNLMDAEKKLAGHGSSVQIADGLGVLRGSAVLQAAAVSGDHVMVHKVKKQKRDLPRQFIQIAILREGQVQSHAFTSGSLLIEIFQEVGIDVLPGSMVDDQGRIWMGDGESGFDHREFDHWLLSALHGNLILCCAIIGC